MFTDYIQYQIPNHLVSAIFDDDYSGLSEDDADYLQEFMETLPNGTFEVPMSDKYFTRFNDVLPLACDVVDMVYYLR